MPFDYCEAASLSFGSDAFSIREFASRMGSRRAAQTLNEMKVRGLVERIARGRYRLLGPAERPDLRSSERLRVRGLILASPLPKAWAGPTAVEVWTGGRYRVSPSVYLSEFHLSIPRSSERAWREYLRGHRISADPSRRIGSKVVLHPTNRFRSAMHAGEPVLSRREVLGLIRAHRGIYADADELMEHGS
jgi:hypothetical protein